jgi:hypothetical protein
MKMRFLTSAVAVAALLGLACGALATKWETVSEGGMTVEMPGTPKKQTQTVQSPAGPVTVNILGVERSSEAFMVAYNEFPAQIANALTDPKTLLDSGRDGAIRNVNGKLTSERNVQIGSYPGREIVGEVPDKKASFTARIYWAKPRLYQIIYISPQGKTITDDGKKFLDSLKIQ